MWLRSLERESLFLHLSQIGNFCGVLLILQELPQLTPVFPYHDKEPIAFSNKLNIRFDEKVYQLHKFLNKSGSCQARNNAIDNWTICMKPQVGNAGDD